MLSAIRFQCRNDRTHATVYVYQIDVPVLDAPLALSAPTGDARVGISRVFRLRRNKEEHEEKVTSATKNVPKYIDSIDSTAVEITAF